MFSANLQISNEIQKQQQATDRNQNCEESFPDIGTCLKVLTNRTAKIGATIMYAIVITETFYIIWSKKKN